MLTPHVGTGDGEVDEDEVDEVDEPEERVDEIDDEVDEADEGTGDNDKVDAEEPDNEWLLRGWHAPAADVPVSTRPIAKT